MDITTIGKQIAALRKERGIKQKDFISRMQTAGLDINPTSYSKLEGQVRMASDKEIYIIAKILGISHSLYYKIETGERNPSYNFLCKFKNVYPNADIDSIFFTNLIDNSSKQLI